MQEPGLLTAESVQSTVDTYADEAGKHGTNLSKIVLADGTVGLLVSGQASTGILVPSNDLVLTVVAPPDGPRQKPFDRDRSCIRDGPDDFA
jgi:hypothetical protein